MGIDLVVVLVVGIDLSIVEISIYYPRIIFFLNLKKFDFFPSNKIFLEELEYLVSLLIDKSYLSSLMFSFMVMTLSLYLALFTSGLPCTSNLVKSPITPEQNRSKVKNEQIKVQVSKGRALEIKVISGS